MKKDAFIRNAKATIAARDAAAAAAEAIVDACPLCKGGPGECSEFSECAACPINDIVYPDTGAVIAARDGLALVETFSAIPEDDRARLAAIPAYAQDWRGVKDIKARLNISWNDLKLIAEWCRDGE